MSEWNKLNRRYSALQINDGPTLHKRLLGVYSSDLDHEPRFPIHSSTNVVTIRYSLHFDQFLKSALPGKYVVSFWRLEWNTETQGMTPIISSLQMIRYYSKYKSL